MYHQKFRKLETFEILGHIFSREHDSLQFISIILLHNLATVYFRVVHVHVCFCKLTLFYLGLIFLWRPVHRNTKIPSRVLLRQQPFLSQQWKLKKKFNNCIQIDTLYNVSELSFYLFNLMKNYKNINYNRSMYIIIFIMTEVIPLRYQNILECLYCLKISRTE